MLNAHAAHLVEAIQLQQLVVGRALGQRLDFGGSLLKVLCGERKERRAVRVAGGCCWNVKKRRLHSSTQERHDTDRTKT